MTSKDKVLAVHPTAEFCFYWTYGNHTAGIVADNPDPDGDDLYLAEQDIEDAPANEQALWDEAARKVAMEREGVTEQDIAETMPPRQGH